MSFVVRVLLRHREYDVPAVQERAQLPLASLPPSALIREIYSAGEIDRKQFETLLRLLPLRNELVHGFGSPAVGQAEELGLVVNSLLAELRP